MSDKNRASIKFCPFCGADAQTDFIEGESYLIECSECGGKTDSLDSMDEAIDAWNLRAQPDRVALSDVTLNRIWLELTDASVISKSALFAAARAILAAQSDLSTQSTDAENASKNAGKIDMIAEAARDDADWSRAEQIRRLSAELTDRDRIINHYRDAMQADVDIAGRNADAIDAARWRHAIRYVGADQSTSLGVQYFVLRGVPELPGADLMRGGVSEHYTNAIDAAIAARKDMQ